MRFDGKRLVSEKKDFYQIGELNTRHGLTTAAFVFNHPDGGIRASLIEKKDRQKLLDNLEHMIQRAKRIGCRAFICGSGNKVPGASREESIECLTESLSRMAAVCSAARDNAHPRAVQHEGRPSRLFSR